MSFQNPHTSKHHGKIALITGGTSGLGSPRHSVWQSRARRVIVDAGADRRRSRPRWSRLATARPGSAAIFPTPRDLDRLYSTVEKQVGRLDILFANAGWRRVFRPLATSLRTFDKRSRSTSRQPCSTVQKALPLMPAGSAIVINGSMVSVKGLPAFVCMPQARPLCVPLPALGPCDLKDRGIRVNVVAPGTIVTPAYKSELGLSDEQIEGFKNQAAALARTRSHRHCRRNRQGGVVSRLEDASYITGIELFVDWWVRRQI